MVEIETKKHEREDPGLAWEDILLFHVLPKLPVKTLFRFKFVCKKWLNWISKNPIFIREQCRRSLASPGIVYVGSGGLEFLSIGGTRIDVPDPFLNFLEGWQTPNGIIPPSYILSACNGLLCILQSRNGAGICICNPVTMESSPVPVPVLDKCMIFIGLAFDPLDSPHAYKLVCFYPTSGELESKELSFEVFSSDTGVWTMSEKNAIIADSKWYPNVSKSVLAGGILYWVVGAHIVWFNPERDLAGVLVLPPVKDVIGPWPNYAIGMWKERLTYAIIMGDKMEAWIMSELKWTRICRASLGSAIKGLGTDMFETKILPYHGGEFLYFAVQDKMRLDVIYYNMKTRELNKSQACGNNAYWEPFFTYNNNFVRLPKLSKHLN